MLQRYPRVAIAGLPGSGKSTLAKILLIEYDGFGNRYTTNKICSYVHGDEILADNLIKVCRVLDSFIAEHFCIADLLAEDNDPPVDLVILLDIQEDLCRKRIANRQAHQVEVPCSSQELKNKMYSSIKKLKYKGITILVLNDDDEKYIEENNLIGTRLMQYLLDKIDLQKNIKSDNRRLG